MVSSPEVHEERPAWFVGAIYYEGPLAGDQTSRFMKHGMWEHGFTDWRLDLVNEI